MADLLVTDYSSVMVRFLEHEQGDRSLFLMTRSNILKREELMFR